MVKRYSEKIPIALLILLAFYFLLYTASFIYLLTTPEFNNLPFIFLIIIVLIYLILLISTLPGYLEVSDKKIRIHKIFRLFSKSISIDKIHMVQEHQIKYRNLKWFFIISLTIFFIPGRKTSSFEILTVDGNTIRIVPCRYSNTEVLIEYFRKMTDSES